MLISVWRTKCKASVALLNPAYHLHKRVAFVGRPPTIPCEPSTMTGKCHGGNPQWPLSTSFSFTRSWHCKGQPSRKCCQRPMVAELDNHHPAPTRHTLLADELKSSLDHQDTSDRRVEVYGPCRRAFIQHNTNESVSNETNTTASMTHPFHSSDDESPVVDED